MENVPLVLAQGDGSEILGSLTCFGVLILVVLGIIYGGKSRRKTMGERWGEKMGTFVSGNWGGKKWGENLPQGSKLTTCLDCGNHVSRRASTCPKCGAPMNG